MGWDARVWSTCIQFDTQCSIVGSLLSLVYNGPLIFKFLDFLFENEVLGYNDGVLITKSLIGQAL